MPRAAYRAGLRSATEPGAIDRGWSLRWKTSSMNRFSTEAMVDQPQLGSKPPPSRLAPIEGPAMRKMSVATGLFILVVLLLPLALRLWLDARWFGAQQLEAVFLLRLRTQLALGLVAGLVASSVTALSLGWAVHHVREVPRKENQDVPHLARLSAAVLPLSMLAGVILGLAAFGQWQTLLGFQAQVPFESRDPSFGQDIAFYVWTLPFVLAVRDWIAVTVLLVSLVTAFIYALGFGFIRRPESSELSAYAREFRGHPLATPAVRHLSLLGAMLLALLSATYWLNNWLLVYSNRGVVYGATATDVHAVYPANVIMACLAGGMAVLLVVLAIRARAQALGPLVAAALVLPIAWLVLALVLGGLWPGLYERFAVHPQQLAAETPYIRNNIVSTRRGDGPRAFDVRELADAGNLDSSILADNQSALSDVRITDWRPLQSAYNQLQRIRQYYEFVDVDVDRYDLQAGRRQVMLSTRELDTNSLAQVARTWQNTHLVYTHGQGVVVSPVSQVDDQGLPGPAGTQHPRDDRGADPPIGLAAGVFRAASSALCDRRNAPERIRPTRRGPGDGDHVTLCGLGRSRHWRWASNDSPWRRPWPTSTSCSAVTSEPIPRCCSIARCRSAWSTRRRSCGWTATPIR